MNVYQKRLDAMRREVAELRAELPNITNEGVRFNYTDEIRQLTERWIPRYEILAWMQSSGRLGFILHTDDLGVATYDETTKKRRTFTWAEVAKLKRASES